MTISVQNAISLSFFPTSALTIPRDAFKDRLKAQAALREKDKELEELGAPPVLKKRYSTRRSPNNFIIGLLLWKVPERRKFPKKAKKTISQNRYNYSSGSAQKASFPGID